MRLYIILTMLFSTGCQTEKAYLRAYGRHNYQQCLNMASYSMPFQIRCKQASSEWCKSHGLEEDCAEGP